MGRYVDACARKNMKPPKGKGGCSRSNKVTVAVRRSPDVASPASRRSASRAAGRSTQARAAASLVHAAIGAGVPGLAWLVLVIAMFNGDPARFSTSASWHIPSPAPPPLPVLAPSQCPTKTLFLCRERDRPRFSEAEFRLRRDAYDTAKVQYSNFRRSGSLGSQMDVDPGRAAVDLEAAGAQSDGTDLCSSDGEIAPASGDAVVAWSCAQSNRARLFCAHQLEHPLQPLWQMLTSVPAFGVQGACRPVSKTGVTMRCRPTADDTCSGARVCRLELSPITPRELSLLSLVRSQSAFSCSSTDIAAGSKCVRAGCGRLSINPLLRNATS
jgi:hypothetical protein